MVCAISRDRRRVIVRSGRRGDRQLWLIDRAEGTRSPLLIGEVDPPTIADAWFGADDETVYMHTDHGREFAALWAFQLGGAGRCASYHLLAERDGSDLEMVALPPGGETGALVWNVDGRSEIELIRLDGLRVTSRT